MTMTQTLKDALLDAEKAIAAAREEIKRQRELLEKLEVEKRGLEFALARHNGTMPRVPADWGSMTRPDAVLKIMQELGRSATAGELSKLLKEKGRLQDEPNFVSAALSTLKGRSKVKKAAGALWALPGDGEEELGKGGGGEEG